MRDRTFFMLGWLSLAIATSLLVLVRGQDEVTIINGWTQVNQYWPMQQSEFFIANSKGHYSVEAKLPENPANDYIVTLEYFYHYDKMQPSILVVPCGGDAISLRQDSSNRNKWVIHELEISKEQCTARPTISYSVLLHDSSSVFAWKYMRVSQKGTLEESDSFDSGLVTHYGHTTSPNDNRPTGQHIASDYERITTREYQDQILATDFQASTLPESTTNPLDFQRITPPVTESILTTVNQDQTQPSSLNNLDESSTQESSTSPTPFSEPDNLNVRQQLTTKRILLCRARSCDSSIFDYSRFRPLINGIPEGVTQEELVGGKLMHLSTSDNKPLTFTIRSDYIRSINEVELCLNFQLYMETNTVIDFELSLGSDGFRLLESITRETTDTTANKWDRFKRCLSEYLPKLTPSSYKDDSLMLRLVPRNLNNGKRLISVLVDMKDVSFIRRAYPVVEYLPDLATYTSSLDLEKYWILDKDGLIKPQIELVHHESGKKLHISQIDSHQKSFDLTSRWLKVNAIDLQDNRFLFTYRIQYADWIKSLDFEFQSSTSEGNKWISQNLYKAPDTSIGNQSEVRQKRDTSSSSLSDNPLPISAIKLKGLTSDEFRVRLRHHIKPTTFDSASNLASHKELEVNSLAFGDICALGSYCKNDGKCKPTGLATAQCTCPDGFSGDHCDEVHPCDAYYGLQRGSELCESIGSKCEPRLPVFRCVWPNDEYLSSKVLYQLDAQGNRLDVANQAELQAESELKWKEKAESMTRLVLILSVFMIALLLFAFVIVGNLIGRLMKSKNNLKNTQLEMHQINKRSTTTNNQPTASTSFNTPTRFPTSTALRRQSSGAPTGSGGPISYSNRSFDAS